MKNRIISVITLIAVLSLFSSTLTGCTINTTDEVPADVPSAGNTAKTDNGNSTAAPLRAVDLDLTVLSSTMVYSEVYNMLAEYRDYIGKTIRMSGMFVAYSNEDQSNFYPAVIIADAAACCSQGLEFVLEGNPSYPDAYPEMETEITVSGVFDTYYEDEIMYCHLRDAVIESVK